MNAAQVKFLNDLVESLNNKEPMYYADQTRLASLVRETFPTAFNASDIELKPFSKDDYKMYEAYRLHDGREPLVVRLADHTITVSGTEEGHDEYRALVHVDRLCDDGRLYYATHYFKNADHAVRYATFLASNPDVIEALEHLEAA